MPLARDNLDKILRHWSQPESWLKAWGQHITPHRPPRRKGVGADRSFSTLAPIARNTIEGICDSIRAVASSDHLPGLLGHVPDLDIESVGKKTSPEELARIFASEIHALQLKVCGQRECSSEGRLVCNDETQTITLDGQIFDTLTPKQYILFRQIQKAGGQPITRREIGNGAKRLASANAVRRTLNNMPEALQACIICDNTGFAYRLPPIRKTRKK